MVPSRSIHPGGNCALLVPSSLLRLLFTLTMAWRQQQQITNQVAQALSLFQLPGIGGMRPQRNLKNRGTGYVADRGGTGPRCTCCGVSGHDRQSCRRSHKDRNMRGVQGHLSKVCRHNANKQQQSQGQQQQNKPPKANTGNARVVTPAVSYTAAAKWEVPAPWYCQECGDAVRPQLSK